MRPRNAPDDFEKSLSRQPVKRIPGEWRADILAAAAAAAPVPHQAFRTTERSSFRAFCRELSALLWPHPKAWAGLAAAWMLILALNLVTREGRSATAVQTARPSPEVMIELRQQHQLYAELMGLAETSDAERPPSSSPKPHSEREEILAG